jgi:predicted GIY-YIG superfamily endonuclease
MALYNSGRPNKYNPTTGMGNKPPHKAGEYRIRNEQGIITYIGETNDLGRRTNEHIKSGKLPVGGEGKCTIEWKTADENSTSVTRREHERMKIAQHNPTQNKSSGGEGRVATR